MQTMRMYGYYTAFALRATETPIKGPRDLIETLIGILQIFSLVITEENEFTPTPEFLQFLETNLDWLASIDDDTCLYNFQNKSHVTEVKSLLTYPHTPLQRCIKYWDDLMDIAIIFRRLHDQLGTRVLNDLPRDEYQSLGKQFAAVNTLLAHILRSMPPADYDAMHENNRELYYELNKYILNPTRIDRMAHYYGINSIEYLDGIFGMDE